MPPGKGKDKTGSDGTVAAGFIREKREKREKRESYSCSVSVGFRAPFLTTLLGYPGIMKKKTGFLNEIMNFVSKL